MPPCDFGAKDCTCSDCREMEDIRSSKSNNSVKTDYESELRSLYATDRALQAQIDQLTIAQRKNSKKIKEQEKLLLQHIRNES